MQKYKQLADENAVPSKPSRRYLLRSSIFGVGLVGHYPRYDRLADAATTLLRARQHISFRRASSSVHTKSTGL